jgi:hypothetical protein
MPNIETIIVMAVGQFIAKIGDERDQSCGILDRINPGGRQIYIGLQPRHTAPVTDGPFAAADQLHQRWLHDRTEGRPELGSLLQQRSAMSGIAADLSQSTIPAIFHVATPQCGRNRQNLNRLEF